MIFKKFSQFGRRSDSSQETNLFSLFPSSSILERLKIEFDGRIAICITSINGQQFEKVKRRFLKLLELSKDEFKLSYHISLDDYGYIWLIISTSETFDEEKVSNAITAISFAITVIKDNKLTGAILYIVFEYVIENSPERMYLVYNFKSKKIYPYIPTGEDRNTKREQEISSLLKKELPVEEDVSLWYPISNMPFQ